jgi:hypothetical protein
MARSHRESHHSDGITDQKSLQQTSATKSANNGLMQRNHRSPYSITFDQFEPGRHSGNLGTSGSRKSQPWPREVYHLGEQRRWHSHFTASLTRLRRVLGAGCAATSTGASSPCGANKLRGTRSISPTPMASRMPTAARPPAKLPVRSLIAPTMIGL